MGGVRVRRWLALMALIILVLAACTPGEEDGATPATLSVQEQSTFTNNEIVVVRAYFEDEATGRDIATTFEPIESDYAKGYVVLSLSAEEYTRLRAEGQDLGVRVEIDEAATKEQSDLLNQLNSVQDDAISLQSIPRFSCYRTVEETFGTARDIAAEYPDLASWDDVGNSWDKTQSQGGYDIQVLKLTNKNTGGDKPKAFITSAIHAREYSTAELMTRFAEYLVENYGSDPDVTWILDTSEVHLMLQTNPDGRKIAEGGVLWRKNTNDNYCSGGLEGADLNRNFDFEWNTGGSSPDQCNQTYHGPSAASEPEVQAVQNYMLDNFADNRGSSPTAAAPADTPGLYIDVHSSGKLMLWPWGGRETPAPNGTALQTLGRKLAYFNDHLPQQSVGLYPTSGTTNDFSYGELGIASLTFELGTEFFESCSYFENTLFPDNLDSLLYALKVTRAPYQLPAGPEALGLELSGDTISATLDDTRFNNSNGRESTGTIAQARYTIDTPPWESGANPQAMTSSDGGFDDPRETVQATIDTSGLDEGRHTVYVQGRDDDGNWGPVSAIFLNTDGSSPPPPPSEGETFTGNLSGTGERAYEPDGSWYQSQSAGTHSGTLTGSGSNFDLYLYKWDSGARSWEQVSRSVDSGSSETISYDGAAGYYIWLVYSRSGSGDYSLTLNRP